MTEPRHVLRWQSPPAGKRPPVIGRRSSVYDEAAAKLRENPGLWGVIAEGNTNYAAGLTSHIRCGTLPCFRPAGSFEAMSRQDGGVRTVYVRYVGESDDA